MLTAALIKAVEAIGLPGTSGVLVAATDGSQGTIQRFTVEELLSRLRAGNPTEVFWLTDIGYEKPISEVTTGGYGKERRLWLMTDRARWRAI